MNATNVSLLRFLFLAWATRFFSTMMLFHWYKNSIDSNCCVYKHSHSGWLGSWFAQSTHSESMFISCVVWFFFFVSSFHSTKDTKHKSVSLSWSVYRKRFVHCHYYGTIKMKMKTKPTVHQIVAKVKLKKKTKERQRQPDYVSRTANDNAVQ